MDVGKYYGKYKMERVVEVKIDFLCTTQTSRAKLEGES
jgi:hypothetical protein